MNLYNHYVKLGKDLVVKVEAYQAKIAEYAALVCDIRHGGRSDGYYTIKDYADDIGLPHKRLQNWVQAYRNVVIKLDRPILTAKQWSDVRKTNDIITTGVARKNKTEGTPGRRRAINTPKKEVQAIFNQINSGDEEKPFILELNRAVVSAKHIKFLMSKRDLNIGSTETLTGLMEDLDKASDLINDHLTRAKRLKRLKG